MSKYVTNTGRAISEGRVTRESRKVKRGTDSRPLPIHLTCHPKRLAPTPVHPGCFRSSVWLGRGIVLADELTDTEIMLRFLLKPPESGNYALYVQGAPLGKPCSLEDALTYKIALERHKVPACSVVQL